MKLEAKGLGEMATENTSKTVKEVEYGDTLLKEPMAVRNSRHKNSSVCDREWLMLYDRRVWPYFVLKWMTGFSRVKECP